MKTKFNNMKAPKHGKLGGLFFDEVKIKEGLVFDSSSWELIGFADALEEKDQQPGNTCPAIFLPKYIFLNFITCVLIS